MKLAIPLLPVIIHAVVAEEVTDKCDASKCRSPGLFGDRYDCWGVAQSETIPMHCAEEYVVQDLSNVTTLYDALSDTTFRYYTCCPPGYTSPMLEECTDTACNSGTGAKSGTDCWADGPLEPMTCGGDIYTFPRKTDAKLLYYSRYYYHYVCCQTSDGTPQLNRNLFVAEAIRTALGALGLCCTLILILGICFSQRARKHTFNVYIVALGVPDAIYNIASIMMGAMTIRGNVFPWDAVNFVAFFYSASNVWLSTILAYRLYILLRNSRCRKRTPQPSLKSVWIETTVVYICSLLFATWMFVLLRAQIDRLTDERSNLIAMVLSFLVMALGPTMYLAYICIHVWRGRLLPLNGRTRALALYFLRIVVSFLICWIPGIVIQNYEKTNLRQYHIPLHYIAVYLGSLQSIFSFVTALTKSDVRTAVKEFLLCGYQEDEHRDGEVRAFSEQFTAQWGTGVALLSLGSSWSNASITSQSLQTEPPRRRASLLSNLSRRPPLLILSRHRRDVSSLTVVNEGDVTEDEEGISNTFLHVTNETDVEQAMGAFISDIFGNEDVQGAAECCASTDEAGSSSSADREIVKSTANEVEESRANIHDDSNETESEKDGVGDVQGAAECRASTEDKDAMSNTSRVDEKATTHNKSTVNKETGIDDTNEAFCESEKDDEGHVARHGQGEAECFESTEDEDATSDTSPLDEGATSNASIAEKDDEGQDAHDLEGDVVGDDVV